MLHRDQNSVITRAGSRDAIDGVQFVGNVFTSDFGVVVDPGEILNGRVA